MRFPQLKIGQRFEYQGKKFTKTDPLTASEEGTGASRMIRRSAKVMLLDGTVSETSLQQVKQSYSWEEVVELCREYRSKLTLELQQIADENGSL
ncbi:MAG: hypothetical protein KZQ81_04450 [Candidatus Thiodiazotropha sp. (ex Rostrolucina anterorostrata)]|nr:hypothetical protein [Candidatus Thiodiazotropha sp. (ex Rostrolucina anterorostrata)]